MPARHWSGRSQLGDSLLEGETVETLEHLCLGGAEAKSLSHRLGFRKELAAQLRVQQGPGEQLDQLPARLAVATQVGHRSCREAKQPVEPPLPHQAT